MPQNPQIFIAAHLDTVFPKGTVAERPFSIDGSRAYEFGIIDMKASHVLTYYAINAPQTKWRSLLSKC